MVIDAHVHLWRYEPQEYPWIDESMRALRRDVLPGELGAAMRRAGVDGAVAVQARQSVRETEFLLSLAERDPALLGVVGWLPLAEPALGEALEHCASHALLKGVRHIVQDEPEGFLDGEAFHRGVAELAARGLTYDLLVYEERLPEAIRFVDRHPAQSFVVDHLAKPRVRAGSREPWASNLRELARRPHVVCKLSGLVTEADPAHWSAEQLTPYLDIALEAFGPERLLVGTDWPLVTLGCPYEGWWELVRSWAAQQLGASAYAALMGDNAQRVYRLEARRA